MNEPNIVLSYYAQNQSLRRTNYYHHTVDAFNKAEHLPSPLRFTTQEIPLTAEMAAQHFEKISQLGEEIESNPTPYIYFARAIEFALVQDYASALTDALSPIWTHFSAESSATLYAMTTVLLPGLKNSRKSRCRSTACFFRARNLPHR